jgi:MFS family permease
LDNQPVNVMTALPEPEQTRVALAASPITAIQWLICAVACLGFTFDLYEGLMLALIVRPLLIDLGHLTPGSRELNLLVGLLFFVPTAIGGIFGAIGGYLTDLFGRRRVLVWSILLYTISACAAGFATSIPAFMALRCTTMIGVSVEFVAGVTWIAELFPTPRQRESVLGYTQAFYNAGGFLVAGAYYFAVTYADRLPSIWSTHQPWRYTLLSGLIPAIPLILVRPFLPESPVWKEKKLHGTLRQPRLLALFEPSLKRTTWVVTLLVGCSFVLAYGAMQQTVRIVPGLPGLAHTSIRHIEQTVSSVQLFQELGGVAGRILFVLIMLRIAAQRTRLRAFLGSALVIYAWMYLFSVTRSLMQQEVSKVTGAALTFTVCRVLATVSWIDR